MIVVIGLAYVSRQNTSCGLLTRSREGNNSFRELSDNTIQEISESQPITKR
jgi:hypothetical protein|tara:strand:- start:651 stop:803 length:153 start_codon:yes stop_codon:yes gene_type:complete